MTVRELDAPRSTPTAPADVGHVLDGARRGGPPAEPTTLGDINASCVTCCILWPVAIPAVRNPPASRGCSTTCPSSKPADVGTAAHIDSRRPALWR